MLKEISTEVLQAEGICPQTENLIYIIYIWKMSRGGKFLSRIKDGFNDVYYNKLVAQLVKNLPAVQETCDRPLGWEDPLEKEWLLTPVSLPGKSHGQRNLVGCSP